jgi:hypothetical protein
LGRQFDIELPVQHLPLRLGIGTDVARHDAPHQPRRNQLADAKPGTCRVVGDHRQTLLALPHQFIDQAPGGADGHEAADHQGRSVRNAFYGVAHLECLGHDRPPWRSQRAAHDCLLG